MTSKFLRSMYNKTIIGFGFCDIQNNQGLGKGSRDGAVVRALSPMCPGFDSGTRRHMLVEFVVDRFFSGSFGFSLSSKTNISKFQFDLELSSTLSGDCASTPFV